MPQNYLPTWLQGITYRVTDTWTSGNYTVKIAYYWDANDYENQYFWYLQLNGKNIEWPTNYFGTKAQAIQNELAYYPEYDLILPEPEPDQPNIPETPDEQTLLEKTLTELEYGKKIHEDWIIYIQTYGPPRS